MSNDNERVFPYYNQLKIRQSLERELCRVFPYSSSSTIEGFALRTAYHRMKRKIWEASASSEGIKSWRDELRREVSFWASRIPSDHIERGYTLTGETL